MNIDPRQLVQVLRADDVQALRAWLEGGSDANLRVGPGIPILALAVQVGAMDCVRELVEKKADVNAKDGQGQSVGLYATAIDHPEIMTLLIQAGLELNQPLGDDGVTLLMNLATAGYSRTVQVLIDHGATIDAQDEQGWTALLCALSNAHERTAAILIERGADVNLATRDGMTPLMAAVEKNLPNTVGQLLARGASKTARNGAGHTAAKIAVLSGNMSILMRLESVETPPGLDLMGLDPKSRAAAHTLIQAARANDVAMLKELLAAGVDVNARGELQTTALHKAARANAVEAVCFLLDAGADVQLRDTDGHTAIFDAAYREYEEVVELLEKRGLSRYE
jgi:ankyrin repeat protein